MPKQARKPRKVDRRGEAVLELCECQCGCGHTQLFDVRHKQKFIKGHGGLTIMARRKDGLKAVLALALLGRGATWQEAIAAARALVEKSLTLAKQVVGREWDYLSMSWRAAA